MKKNILFCIPFLFLFSLKSMSQENGDPPVRLQNINVRMEWLDPGQLMSINITARLGGFDDEIAINDVRLRIFLLDKKGNEIARGEIPWFERLGNQAIGDIQISIKEPKGWNSESPHLYTLAFVLLKQGGVIEQKERLLGLREILVEKGELLVNRSPIKLRGIQIDADQWRGIELKERMRNERNLIDWLEYTHVNTVRIMNATPSEHWMKLCDKRGIYVICDLPSINLADRLRIKMEPLKRYSSLIGWNIVSNEGSETEIRDRIDKVKLIDASRPVCISGNEVDPYVNYVDVLAPQCDDLEEWRDYRSQNIPIIAFDLPFGLNWDFEGLGQFWDYIRQDPFSTGMCFSPFKEDPEWKSWNEKEDTFYYSAFSPMLERIYSPIHLEESKLDVKPGKQVLELTLHNDFDFTNLNEITCQWMLLEGRDELQSGEIQLFLPARKQMQMALDVTLPDELNDHEYFLRLQFLSKTESILHEHRVRLIPENWRNNFLLRLRNLEWYQEWKVNARVEEIHIDHRDYSFRIPSATTDWFLLSKDHNVRLIIGGPYFRLGRKSTNKLNQNDSIWKQEIVSNPELLHREVERLDKETEIRVDYRLPHESNEHFINTKVHILSSPYGFCDVRFYYDTKNSPRMRFEEMGLAFLVPARLNRVIWQGDGPYPTFPGCLQNEIHGIFDFSPIRKLLAGNRQHVDLVAFLDERGYGLGIMMIDGNLNISPQTNSTLVSINSFVAGVGNRYQNSQSILDAKRLDEEQCTAAFRLIPLMPNRYPIAFESMINY